MDKRLILLLLIIVLLAASCTGNSGQLDEINQVDPEVDIQETATEIPSTSTETPIPTFTPRPTNTPKPTQPVNSIPVLPVGEASASSGPWMIVHGADGFYMISEDGSEVWRLPLLHDSLILPGTWSVPDRGGLIAIAHDMMTDKYLEVRT